MIPISPRLMLYGAVGAIVLSIIGAQAVRVSMLKSENAELRSLADRKLAAGLKAYGDAMTTQLAEAMRQRANTQKALDNAAQQTDRAERDAAAAGDAVDRLRDAAGAYAARRCAASARAADAASGPAAADPAAVLAELLGRVAREGADLARIADQRGIAGAACEADRDGLTTP